MTNINGLNMRGGGDFGIQTLNQPLFPLHLFFFLQLKIYPLEQKVSKKSLVFSVKFYHGVLLFPLSTTYYFLVSSTIFLNCLISSILTGLWKTSLANFSFKAAQALYHPSPIKQ